MTQTVPRTSTRCDVRGRRVTDRRRCSSAERLPGFGRLGVVGGTRCARGTGRRVGPTVDNVELRCVSAGDPLAHALRAHARHAQRAPGGSPSCRLVSRRPRRSRRWAVAFRMGLDLVARGRLHPAADRRRPRRLARRSPRPGRRDATRPASPTGFLPRPMPSGVPTCVCCGSSTQRRSSASVGTRSPDMLVRTPAAPLTVSSPAWAAWKPTNVSAADAWLDSLDGSDGAGARPGLRLELAPGGGEGARRAAAQPGRPVLVVDAAELWDVRRGRAGTSRRRRPRPTCSWPSAGRRRAWPPLARTLDEARPRRSPSTRPRPPSCFGPAAESSGGSRFRGAVAGRADPLESRVRAVVATPAPASVAAAGLNLDALLRVPLAGHRRRRGAHRGRARRAGGGETAVGPGARAVGRRRPAAPRRLRRRPVGVRVADALARRARRAP